MTNINIFLFFLGLIPLNDSLMSKASDNQVYQVVEASDYSHGNDIELKFCDEWPACPDSDKDNSQ